MRWPWDKPAPAQPVAVRTPGIRSSAVAALRSVDERMASLAYMPGADAWRLPNPAPGVLPAGMTVDAVAMASDYDLTGAYSWAAASGFGEGLAFPGFPYLAELAQRAEYRNISETVAKEMTRKGFRLVAAGEDGKSDRVAELNTECERLHVNRILREMAEMDGLYGRGQLFIDTGASDDDLAAPLVYDPRVIKKGGLKGFKTVEPIWSYPSAYNARWPLKADFYQPLQWYVMGQTVHRSRLLTFISREIPDILKPAYAFAGMSLSQMAMPSVNNWLRNRQSVSDLIHSFTVMVMATNMGDFLNQGSAADLIARAQSFNLIRDNRGLMMVDKDTEELTNVSAPLGTLDHLQAQSQEQMAAVAGIPLVKLLGITPSGLNASSDGEIRVFYDAIHARQEHLFRDNLDKMLKVIQLGLWGEIDPDIRFEFESLWELDDAAKSAVRKSDMDADVEAIDAGVLHPEEVRKRMANDPNGLYHGLDVEDVPEPPEDDNPDILSDPAKSAEPKAEMASGV